MYSLINLENICRTYYMGEEAIEALQEINLDVQKGELLAIFGKSGSGKSTLLNILGILDKPTAGSYYLQGKNVSNLDDKQMARIRCLFIGIIFQSFNLFPELSVRENICVPMYYANKSREFIYRRAQALAGKVGLADRLSHLPNQLSGGQRQRVAIARSLANDPPIILADEPTGNLDDKTGWQIIDIFNELVQEGKTIIMVTHNEEYRDIVDRYISLKDGSLLEVVENAR